MTSQVPVALITGAAHRIGAAIAQYLHAAGFRVIIHYLQSERKAFTLTQKLNDLEKDSALALYGDLRIPSTSEQLITQTLAWGNQLNLLVNNASVFISDALGQTINDWEDSFNTNVRAPFLLSHAAFPHLSVVKGCVINISDIHATKPLKGYGIYCQTKAAVNMQTKVLAREFAPNVRVNAIAPGAIAWPENANALSAEIKNKILNQTPMKQHGHPDYIAKAILGLIENPFVTGQILCVDGGRSLT